MKLSMRVLHAYKIYLPEIYGGIPHVVATLAGLSRMGFETFILVARALGLGRDLVIDGAAVRAVTSWGTLFSMPLAPGYPLALALRARAMDVVVFHAPFPLADMGLLLGFPSQVALVVHWHAEMIGRPMLTRLMAPLVRHTLARADRIVVSDPAMIANSLFLEPYAEKCTVVPYGCDVGYWSTLEGSQRKIVDELTSRYPRLVVAVGRLVSYKGYEVFLRALQEVDAQAVVIGEGDLKPELERLASHLGVSDRVAFVGGLQRDEVKQHIHAAKVLAFPSVTDAEAFGLVQLEAMSAGRPIVNTSLATAVPHIARDGREGLTVAPNDPRAFARALRRLLDQPELASGFGATGQARARAEYDHSLFLRRVQAIYTEAAGQRRSAR
jgi:glycosyltransferase involved in cell wall biosynthesis